MRIGLLSYEYPPETGFGGIGTYTWHHARALARLGHEVHVLAGAREATAGRSSEHDGVHVHRYWADGAMMRLFHSLGGLRLWWTRQRLQNAWSMYRGMRAAMQELRFDVLEMPECGAEGALVTALIDVPTVVRLHSPSRLIMSYYDVRRADIVLCGALEQRALFRATAVTGCSRFVARETRDKLGIVRPITVIPNGLDTEWIEQDETRDVHRAHDLPRRSLMIVFTGRMERRKGIHLCAEIAAAILERHDVTFVLAGDDLFGYVGGTLLPTLAAKSLKGSIHWVGPLGISELRPLVRAADIFLLPSLWENCPYSCLEAMAMGRAVVAADQGGIPEIIQDGVNGLLAEPGDAASFVRRIEHLIEDPGLRARLGSAAKESIRDKYGATDVARLALEVYEDARADRGLRGEP